MELAKYEGDVYIGALSPDGSFAGYSGPYECDVFEPSREAGEASEIRSKRRDMYGQIIHSEQESGKPLLSIGFREQPAEIIQLVYAANMSLVSVAAGTVTDEEVSVADLDKSYLLGHRNIKASPAPVVESQGGSPVTYVSGVDYALDLRSGRITPLAGGDMAADTPINVSYSYDVLSGTAFDGETVQQRHIRVLFDGKNRISQKDFMVEYFDVLVNAPEDMIDLLSSELITANIEGTALTPTGQTKPYRIFKEN